nr:MAG TPA: hypothetical protein [Caudoviricetes sp.]
MLAALGKISELLLLSFAQHLNTNINWNKHGKK